MQIISISGIDGSGKSTQIELLKEYLQSQGKKVFYFHAVQFSIANRNQSNKEAKPPIGGLASKMQTSITKASWLKIQLRKLALMIDICRFKMLVKKLEAQGFDYILSDRYFYDNVINIAYLSLPKAKPSDFRRFSLRGIPRPDFAFYLKTDTKNIMSRERIPDQGLDYLKSKESLLSSFAQENNLTVIDGNRSKEEIFEEIKRIVKQ